jgi:hypothetical protein
MTDDEVAALAALAPEWTDPGPSRPGEPYMVDGFGGGTRQRVGISTIPEGRAFRDERIRQTGDPHGLYLAVTGRRID